MEKGKNVLVIVILGILILGFGIGNVFFLYEGSKSSKIEYAEVKERTKERKESQEEEELLSYTSSLEGFQVAKMDTKNTKTRKDSPKDYILPNSDSKYYKKKDLKGLSKREVQLARNEIYARHGRRFTTDEIRKYFEGKDWYNGIVDEVEDSELNKYEIANRDMIQKYEKSKGWN